MVAGYTHKPFSDFKKFSEGFKSKLSTGYRGLTRALSDTPIGTISRQTREIMDGGAQTLIDGCNFIVRVTNKWFQLRNPLCFQSINFPPPHIPRTSVNPPIATGIYVLVSRGWIYHESFTRADIGRPQSFLRSREQWKYTYLDGEFPWKDVPEYRHNQGKFSVSREGAAWSELEHAISSRGYPRIEDSWKIDKVSYSFTFEDGVPSMASRSERSVNKEIPNLLRPTVLIVGATYEEVLQLVGEDGTGLNSNYQEAGGTPGDGNSYYFYEGYKRWEAYEIGAKYGVPMQMLGSQMDNATERQLLQLLVKRVGNLPAKVPDLFTKQNPETVTIESLAELVLWQTQQMDALLGAYPIDIEIEDVDLVKEGNQTKKISLSNNAEVLAEVVGMVINIKKDTAAILVTALKAMTEAGISKQLSVQGLDVCLANAEYLGYKLEQVSKKIPMMFTPGADGLDASLKESEVEIVTYENKDSEDLRNPLDKLLTMAARWNAQNWRSLGSDLVGGLKKHLVGGTQDIQAQVENDKDGDFSTALNEIEQGFIGTTGITDQQNPWGSPYSDRPKIRPIGADLAKDSDAG